jgi:hypothetical protein
LKTFTIFWHFHPFSLGRRHGKDSQRFQSNIYSPQFCPQDIYFSSPFDEQPSGIVPGSKINESEINEKGAKY